MKHLIVGTFLLILCTVSLVIAEEQMGLNETIANQSENWTLSPQAALALAQTYAADLKGIDNAFLYLKTGNSTNKKGMMDAMYDYEGTMGGWLNTLDNSTITYPKANTDSSDLSNSWNDLNKTLIQIESADKVNLSEDRTFVNQLEKTSWNHVSSFEKLLSYVDENSFDQNTAQIPLYLALMKGCIANDAYELTRNSDDKVIFNSTMKFFDKKIQNYEARFPGISTEQLGPCKIRPCNQY